MSLNLSAEQDTRPGAIGGRELGRSGENGHAGGAEADPLVQLSSLLWLSGVSAHETELAD